MNQGGAFIPYSDKLAAYYATSSGGSAADGITAYAGGGQANATLLTSNFNIVDTVASAGDSCIFNSGFVEQSVANNGANDMNLYPVLGSEFETGGVGMGVNVPLSMAPGDNFQFVKYGTTIRF